MSQPLSLAHAIGRNLRAIRDEHGVTAEDIAGQARSHGLSWERSTVAGIETGRRGLSAEEFILLPAIVTETLRRSGAITADGYVPLAELLDNLGQTTLGGAVLPGEALKRVAQGGPLVVTIDELAGGLHGRLDDAYRDAERHAARSLHAAPLAVLGASIRLWGHGLTEERDRLADEQGAADESTGARRTRRGHITRQLLDELRTELQGDDDGQR